ncbi:probable guanine deaminase [[Candida] railenensis]|uniref:Probable guanine deaminase n=1 Tax=[Candida] railenensis TaxID=45579 RepID=A0A9P0QJ26_9ASCO|nr:probable guanine deaminase [[Candida] railenensis]
MYTLFYGTFIHTPSINEIEIRTNTLVGVDPTGRIDFIRYNYSKSDRDPVKFFFTNHTPSEPIKNFNFQDHSNNPLQFFFPGFVDTHIHASQYPNVGIGIGVPLLDWLKEYTFPTENAFKQENMEMARDVYTKVINRTLQNGTTCASYFTTIDLPTTELFSDLLIKYGQRGFVGKVCMDHNEPYPEYAESFTDCIDVQQKIINYIDQKYPKERREKLITPIITPRFAPVCSEPLLETLGMVSKSQNLPIQTHIAENLKEVELMKELFPKFENYASVYDHFSLLTNRTILAHAVHLTDKECEIISERKCSISHCPTSNTFLSSGEAPVKKYLKHNINVSLGTDLSGGFESSILSIMKHSILVSHHLAITKRHSDPKKEHKDDKLSINEVMYMATLGGAKAVGLSDMVGSFEVGKKWDAQLIDLGGKDSSMDIFEWQVPSGKVVSKEYTDKVEQLLGKWVFNGDDRNCRKVWVNGKVVIDKEVKREDEWVLV